MDNINAMYEGRNDEDLISLIREGDANCQDFLIDKYKKIVKIKARSYFLTGADRDDILQEGMIGLFKAIRDFERGKAASFYSFAELCIMRQIYTAIKASTRKKHFPLNTYISLNRPAYENDSMPLEEIGTLNSKRLNPESILIEKEDREYIERKIGESLSGLETEVLSLYMQGKSYVEIAQKTEKSVKAVDNAIQRIKRKVKERIGKRDL